MKQSITGFIVGGLGAVGINYHHTVLVWLVLPFVIMLGYYFWELLDDPRIAEGTLIRNRKSHNDEAERTGHHAEED